MKCACFILLSLSLNSVLAQEIDKGLFRYKGLKLFSSKAEIISTLGQPERIYEPDYECGFLSSSEQAEVFYSLVYENVTFTGNKKSGYVMESLELIGGVEISYGKLSFNSKTDLDGLIGVFGFELFGQFHDTYSGDKLFRNKGADDGIIFYLENGKVTKLEYWSPC